MTPDYLEAGVLRGEFLKARRHMNECLHNGEHDILKDRHTIRREPGTFVVRSEAPGGAVLARVARSIIRVGDENITIDAIGVGRVTRRAGEHCAQCSAVHWDYVDWKPECSDCKGREFVTARVTCGGETFDRPICTRCNPVLDDTKRGNWTRADGHRECLECHGREFAWHEEETKINWTASTFTKTDASRYAISDLYVRESDVRGASRMWRETWDEARRDREELRARIKDNE